MADCMKDIHCWHLQRDLDNNQSVEYCRFYCCNCGEQTNDAKKVVEQGICTTKEYFEGLKREVSGVAYLSP